MADCWFSSLLNHLTTRHKNTDLCRPRPYQRAIEEVYWRPVLRSVSRGQRPDPKPSLNGVMSQAQTESKVQDYLRTSQALQGYWQRPIAAEAATG